MRRIPTAGSEHRSLALFALTLGVFLVTLNVTVVIVTLPDIQRSLHARTDELEWVIDAYNLVGASLLLIGRLLRRPVRAQARPLHRLRRVRGRRAPVRARAERAAG